MLNVADEIDAILTAAECLVAEIAARQAQGDAAADSIEQLAQHLGQLERSIGSQGLPLPSQTRGRIASLVVGIRAAAATGGEWLASHGSAGLDHLALLERSRRAYSPPGPV